MAWVVTASGVVVAVAAASAAEIEAEVAVAAALEVGAAAAVVGLPGAVVDRLIVDASGVAVVVDIAGGEAGLRSSLGHRAQSPGFDLECISFVATSVVVAVEAVESRAAAAAVPGSEEELGGLEFSVYSEILALVRKVAQE